jgi:hypothetical protein
MAVTGQPAQTFFRGVLIARTTCLDHRARLPVGQRKEEQDKGCMTASRGVVKPVLTSRAMGGA